MPREPEDRLNQQLDRLCYGRPESGKIYQTEITESVRTPGKFEASIDGIPLQGEFDSEHDAMTFLSGFVLGASGAFELAKAAKAAREVFIQQTRAPTEV